MGGAAGFQKRQRFALAGIDGFADAAVLGTCRADMHCSRHVEGIVGVASPAFEDDGLVFAHLPIIVGEHQVREILAPVLGPELQGFLRCDHIGAAFLKELAETTSHLVPHAARTNHRHDLCQRLFVQLGAMAQEGNLLRRLHFADVQPGIVGIAPAQICQFALDIDGQAQVVEPDAGTGEP